MAALGRAKKLPALKKLLSAAGPKRRQTPEEMAAIVRSMHAAMTAGKV